MKGTYILGRGIVLALLLFLLIPAGGAFACGGSWEGACWDWGCVCFRCQDRNNNVLGLCVPCGAPWEGFCWSGPACDDRTNNLGICTPCGGHWQAACWSGPACDARNNNIASICTPCGAPWELACSSPQQPCDSGNDNIAGICTPSCEARYNNVLGICTHCGASGELACWKGQPCDSGNDNILGICTLKMCDLGYNNVLGICTPCGAPWELACWSGQPCDSGNDNILGICTPSCGPGYNNVFGIGCVACGDSLQGMCLVGAPCKDRNNNVAGVCFPCGAHWEVACLSGLACDDRNNNVFGICTPCGGGGELICLGGATCDEGYRNTLGLCAYSGYSEEPTTNSTVTVPQQTPGQPVWGWADVHEHQFANLAYGGAMFWGAPFDPRGVNAALAWCDYTWDFPVFDPIISPNEAFTLDTRGYHIHGQGLEQLTYGMTNNVSTNTYSILPPTWHETSGTGSFAGWPSYSNGGHQQMYYKWLERAYQGGMRLLVNLTVNNEVLCEISRKRKTKDAQGNDVNWCDDMVTTDMQIQAMKDLEAFIDSKSGGPGRGWYRIARSAQEARQIIESGKMAVIIGLEIDSLFGCKPDSTSCDETHIRREVQKYYEKGVRYIFPVHMFDNKFAGAALYRDIFVYANFIANESFIEAEECPDTGYDRSACYQTIFNSGECSSSCAPPKGDLEKCSNCFESKCPERDYSYQVGWSTTDDLALDLLYGSLMVLFGDPRDILISTSRSSDCNKKGLTTEGEILLDALMDKKMIFDVDHLSVKALDRVMNIVEARGYPVVSGHPCFSKVNAPGTELARTLPQLERIRNLGGIKTVPGPGGKCGTTRSFAEGYKTLVNIMKKPGVDDDEYPGIALGHDMGCFLPQAGPRFGDDNNDGKEDCPDDAEAAPRLEYPFDAFEPGVTGKFDKQQTGQRIFDFNTQGMAHIGLLPDFLADVRNITQHTQDNSQKVDLNPLFHSAEAFLRMWEKIDNSDKLTVTAQVSGTLGLNGWYTSDVTVAWEIVAGGPLVSTQGCDTRVITTDTTGVTLTCQAATAASQTAASVTIKIDKTPPTYTAVRSPALPWTTQAVRVTFQATDATSGLAGPAAAEVNVDMEGAGLTASYTFTDQAGLITNAVLGGINIDRTPPTIGFLDRTPAPNGNGWNNSDVTVRWTCGDALSGVIVSEVAQTVSTEGTAQSAQGTCTDLAGNTVSATEGGINIDKTPPILNLPENMMRFTDSGQCSAIVNYAVTATDNRPGVAFVSNPPSGSVFPKGVTTVTSIATDASGNMATGTFTVTVVDKELPKISCPDNITKPSDPGRCAAMVNYTVTMTDNCPDVTVISDPPSGSTFLKGTTTVTATSTDAAENSGTCSFTVTVVNTPPVANPISVTPDEDTSVSIVLTGSDVDCDPLMFSFVSNPVNGVLSGAIPNLTYAPNPDYFGPDSFTFRISDGTADSNIATVSIEVKPVNDVPRVTLCSNGSINEGGTFICTGSFSDPDPDTWTGTVDYGDGSGVQPLRLNLDKTLILTRVYADNGTYPVAVVISDNNGGTWGGVLTVSVNNMAPSVMVTADKLLINEGDGVNFTGSYSDPGADTYVIEWDFGDGSEERGSLTPTHVFVENGVYPVTLRVTDDDGGIGIASVSITVKNVAPSVGPITAPVDPVRAGIPIDVSAPFTDPGIRDAHSGVWDWGDASTSAGIVNETDGSGTVTGSHIYTVPGVYTITLTVTDDDNESGTAQFQYVVIYDPEGGFVTGGGWINSPPGAYTANPALVGKATFGFVSKYKKGANVPTGQTEFQFKVASLNFHSESYDWLVVAGPKAQYKGTGTINGTGEYRFMLTAIDGQIDGGQGVDKFRIKIWDKATDDIIYDNQTGASDTDDPTTALGGGSIVIHKE